MSGRHITNGLRWFVIAVLLITTVGIATAQQGDDTPVKPPAPVEEPIPQTPGVDPQIVDGDLVETAAGARGESVPLWNVAGNFTIRDFLGVGTETPATKIHAVYNTNGSTSVRVDNTNGGNAAMSRLILLTNTNNQAVQLQKLGGGYATPWNGLAMNNWARLRTDSAVPGMVIATGGPYPLVFGTGDVERARVSSSGNLLVGTRTDDTHRVTVRYAGDDNAIRVIGPGSYGSGARVNFGDGDYVYLKEDVDDKLTIFASGRSAIMGGAVGIGTTAPIAGSKLDVESTGSIGTYSRVTTATGTNYGVLGAVANTSSMALAGFHPGNSLSDFNVTGRNWWIPAILGIGRNGTFGSSKVDNGIGAVGENTSTTGFRRGVDGETRGNVGYGLYTNGNIYSGGSCTGCTMVYIAQNSSGETLTKGDVVAVRGVGKMLAGQQKPVLLVGKASGADTWVLGVVQSRGEVYAADPEQQRSADAVQGIDGDVAPGDYLLVVTSGLAQVKMGQRAAFAPGAALTVSEVAGIARTADSAAVLVFGRAVDGQADENGLVWAMIETQ